jgi:hypothetical protein
MTEWSDAALYKEGASRRWDDESLMRWYARLDTTTRHRLLALANEQAVRSAAETDAKYGTKMWDLLFDDTTLAATLTRLITTGAYRRELMRVMGSPEYKLEEAYRAIATRSERSSVIKT